MIALVLLNKISSQPLQSLIVSVDYVEKLTGLDFFSGLDDDLENRLESDSDAGVWLFSGCNSTASPSGILILHNYLSQL